MSSTSGETAIVMGLGRFGGGLGAVRFLASRGDRVIVSDPADANTLREPIKQLEPLLDSGSVTLRLGPQTAESLSDAVYQDAQTLVVNPAVPIPWNHPYINRARERGLRITTEIALLIEQLPPTVRLVGVTGTAGKSTTSSMIYNGLRASGTRCHLGGNLGGSLLNRLDSIRSNDIVVLELSSAMLWWLAQRDPGPPSFEVGVLTSFAPNHIDWHGSLEHYESAKKILARATTGTFVDATSLGWPTDAKQVAPLPSVPGDLRVIGSHNTQNAACALAACEALGVHDAWPGIASFPGLPHRLCVIHETIDGIRFINDSKSTTPESAALAIRAIDRPGSTVRLIAGGYDKRVSLDPMTTAARTLARVYAIGTTAQEICSAIPNAELAGTLDQAMHAVARDAQPGDTILLSPGCASWDQFDHFEQRGDRFTTLAHELFRDAS